MPRPPNVGTGMGTASGAGLTPTDPRLTPERRQIPRLTHTMGSVANHRIWAPWRLAYVKDASKDSEAELHLLHQARGG